MGCEGSFHSIFAAIESLAIQLTWIASNQHTAEINEGGRRRASIE